MTQKNFLLRQKAPEEGWRARWPKRCKFLLPRWVIVIKEYKIRHDWMGKLIHLELCKRLKFDHTTKRDTHKPESVLKNKT